MGTEGRRKEKIERERKGEGKERVNNDKRNDLQDLRKELGRREKNKK